MDYKKQYEEWLNCETVDALTKQELIAIKDEKEIEDRFYRNLEFGTGGLRGKIAAGINRLNVYTIAKATQGFAAYLNEISTKPCVCIAYDSRNKSDVFAKTAAQVLAGNGIKVYLYESLRPTPMLSFAVREHQAMGGIVITASHNPKEYNGYKVYGSDGGQITDEAAKKILGLINAVDIFKECKKMDLEEAEAKGLLEYMGTKEDESYYKKVADLVIRKKLVKEKAGTLNIIYTPIHGSGNVPVRTILKKLGFDHVHVIREQEEPDGDFPTAPYPNPENADVFKIAIEAAKDLNPDLIFGTDPDCDRIGVVVKENSGNYKVLTGNQVGILLSEYILNARKEEGILSNKDTIIKTIVTTQMVESIANNYDVQVMNVLTGFKYIGEKIGEFLQTKVNEFVLGFEESYGYLAGDFVRDKDAVIAAVLIAEMALYYKTQGQNLTEVLDKLYEQYGFYKEELIAVQMEGKDGQQKIQSIMNYLRQNPPSAVDGVKVGSIEDYKQSKIYDRNQSVVAEINLPQSNVIKYKLVDESWFVIRPSGTEPKMKIYASVVGKTKLDAEEQMTKFVENIQELIRMD